LKTPSFKEGFDLRHEMGLKGKRMPGDLSHSLPCEIVFRGADTSCRDDDLGSTDGGADGFFHPFEIVAHGRRMDKLDAVFGKGSGDGSGVRINDLAQEKL
jgi:hypothetical protein